MEVMVREKLGDEVVEAFMMRWEMCRICIV